MTIKIARDFSTKIFIIINILFSKHALYTLGLNQKAHSKAYIFYLITSSSYLMYPAHRKTIDRVRKLIPIKESTAKGVPGSRKIKRQLNSLEKIIYILKLRFETKKFREDDC